MSNLVSASPLIHIFALGFQNSIALSDLNDIGNASSEAEILQAVETHLGLPPRSLAGFTLSKDIETGNMTVRPPAVFG